MPCCAKSTLSHVSRSSTAVALGVTPSSQLALAAIIAMGTITLRVQDLPWLRPSPCFLMTAFPICAVNQIRPCNWRLTFTKEKAQLSLPTQISFCPARQPSQCVYRPLTARHGVGRKTPGHYQGAQNPSRTWISLVFCRLLARSTKVPVHPSLTGRMPKHA